MKRILLHIFSIAILLIFTGQNAHAQAFDMTNLDAPNTTCETFYYHEIYKYIDNYSCQFNANWDWEHEDQTGKKDYGLTGSKQATRTRHHVMNLANGDYEYDPLVPTLRTVPEGEETSIRLGNARGARWDGNYYPEGECVYFDYHVTKETSIVLFKYAAIMEEGRHSQSGSHTDFQPRMMISVTNTSNQSLNENRLQFTRYGLSSLETSCGWTRFTARDRDEYSSYQANCTAYWKDWTTVGFDLSEYIGQTVRFQVENYECALDNIRNSQQFLNSYYCYGYITVSDPVYCGKHYGYLYFNLSTTSDEIEVECLGSKAKLTAPEGFFYVWYKNGSQQTQYPRSTRSIEVDADGVSTYSCRLIFIENSTDYYTTKSVTVPQCSIEATEEIKYCASDGLPFEWNGKEYWSSATDDYTCKSKLKPTIDSITHLVLTVYPMPILDEPEEVTICEKDLPYMWHGISCTESKTYEYTEYYENSSCIKAAYTLDLTVNPTTYGTATKWICSNELVTKGYEWWGTTYHSVPETPPTHTYQHLVYDCDSIVTLDLRVCEADTFCDIIQVCSLDKFSYNWDKTTDGEQHKTGADIKNYTLYSTTEHKYVSVQVVDSVKSVKQECLHADTEDPDNMLFCDYIWYLVVQPQTEPKNVKESVTLCANDLPDFSNGETWPYSFSEDGHAITIADTAGVECRDNTYFFSDTLRSSAGCDLAYYDLELKMNTVHIVENVDWCDNATYDWVHEDIGLDTPPREEFEMMTEGGTYHDTIWSDDRQCALRCYTLNLVFHQAKVKDFGGINGEPPRDLRTILGTVYINKGGEYECCGQIFTDSDAGEHSVRGETDYGCDSVVVFTLVVLDNVGHVYKTICPGEEVAWHGFRSQSTEMDTICKTTGDYSFFTKTTLGTDSVAILHLTVLSPREVYESETICKSRLPDFSKGGTWSYTFTGNGENHTLVVKDTVGAERNADGDFLFRDTIPHEHYDCDSVHYVLTLKVEHPVEMPVNEVHICSSETYMWEHFNEETGENYPTRDEFENIATLGELNEEASYIYHDTIWSDDGLCALKSYTLNITFHPVYKQEIGINGPGADHRIKDTVRVSTNELPYTWAGVDVNGNSFVETFKNLNAGDTVTKKHTLATAHYGCDSTVMFTLIVKDQTVYDTICAGEEYRWYKAHSGATKSDTICTTSGIYPRYFKKNKKDALVILDLTVLPVREVSEYATVCTGNLPDFGKGETWSYTFNKNGENHTLVVENTFGAERNADGDLIFRDAVPYQKGTHNCDSVRYMLTLNVTYPVEVPTWVVRQCNTEPYSWTLPGQEAPSCEKFEIMTERGLYYDTIWSDNGCAMAYYTLDLDFYPSYIKWISINGEVKDDRINLGDVVVTRIGDDVVTKIGDEVVKQGGLPFHCGDHDYTEPGKHEEKTKSVHGCDSVIVFNLVIESVFTEDEQVKCASELPFEWNGNTIESEAADNGRVATLTSAVTGGDSIVTLVLTVVPSYGQDAPIEDGAFICYSELADFVWEGHSFASDITADHSQTQTASYTQTLKTAKYACDSVVTFTLTVNPADGDTICASELPYYWRGTDGQGNSFSKKFTEEDVQSGNLTRTQHLKTTDNRDSIVTFTLTVNPTYHITDGAEACRLPYEWKDERDQSVVETFDAAGTRTHTFTSVHGCDSVVTFTLVVSDTYLNTFAAGDTICDTELPYQWRNRRTGEIIETFTAAGSSTKTLQTVSGCDSVVTFTLTVLPSYRLTDGITVCEAALPYTWQGEVFMSSGTRTKTLHTVYGYDSVVTFTLNVVKTTRMPKEDVVWCVDNMPYLWKPWPGRFRELTNAGLYGDTLRTRQGCDSIIYSLNLQVYSTEVQATAAVVNQTICPDSENLLIDFSYTEGRPMTYELLFDSAAQAQGFRNLDGGISDSYMRLTVPMPHDPMVLNSYPKADDYNATLRVNDWCEHVSYYPIGFTVLYPASLIVQKWNDVLAIYNERYNGGMAFSSIRWYHEGRPVTAEGENSSYIYEFPNLSFGEAYWAELVRAEDNKTFRTCDFYPERKTALPLHIGERIRLTADQTGGGRTIRITSETDGDWIVYDVTGKLLMQGRFGEGTDNLIVFNAQYPVGTYMIRFRMSDGTVETRKWLVH